ncbi:MAG TPA: hypothetical protein VN704_07235, partial [Verrucomicrobiae bacterium]|nr:hypothetical protein [Verrucomicrobiae bacterium]
MESRIVKKNNAVIGFDVLKNGDLVKVLDDKSIHIMKQDQTTVIYPELKQYVVNESSRILMLELTDTDPSKHYLVVAYNTFKDGENITEIAMIDLLAGSFIANYYIRQHSYLESLLPCPSANNKLKFAVCEFNLFSIFSYDQGQIRDHGILDENKRYVDFPFSGNHMPIQLAISRRSRSEQSEFVRKILFHNNQFLSLSYNARKESYFLKLFNRDYVLLENIPLISDKLFSPLIHFNQLFLLDSNVVVTGKYSKINSLHIKIFNVFNNSILKIKEINVPDSFLRAMPDGRFVLCDYDGTISYISPDFPFKKDLRNETESILKKQNIPNSLIHLITDYACLNPKKSIKEQKEAKEVNYENNSISQLIHLAFSITWPMFFTESTDSILNTIMSSSLNGFGMAILYNLLIDLVEKNCTERDAYLLKKLGNIAVALSLPFSSWEGIFLVSVCMLAKQLPAPSFEDTEERDMWVNLFSRPKTLMGASALGLMSQNGISPLKWARSFISGGFSF